MWLRAMLRCRRRLSTGNPPAGALKAALGGEDQRILRRGTGRHARQGSDWGEPTTRHAPRKAGTSSRPSGETSGELMVESSPSRQRRPPYKTNKGMSDEAADAAAHTYSLTYSKLYCRVYWGFEGGSFIFSRNQKRMCKF